MYTESIHRVNPYDYRVAASAYPASSRALELRPNVEMIHDLLHIRHFLC